MNLEYLQKEMIKAMKSGEKVRKEVLSGVISAIKKVAIDKKQKDNITEELVSEVLLKEQKTIQEMVDTCPNDRTDLLTAYNEKLSIIKEYAPQLLTDEKEIEEKFLEILKENNIEPLKQNKGQIMKTVMPVFKGKADMKVVNIVINKSLK